MARLFYSLIVTLALPLVVLRLLWRGRKQPEYRAHWAERFSAAFDGAPPEIWVHAVSVGEVRAMEPLIRALAPRRVLLTCMTPTGRATAQALYGDAVTLRYLPYDQAWLMRAFVRRVKPRALLLAETEVWPNLIAACAAEGVPVALVNARMSEKSARGYARFAALTRPAFASLAMVSAQTEADAVRLRALGAARIAVTGNIKFDVTPDAALLARGRAWRAVRGAPALMLASTREAEETLFIGLLEGLSRVLVVPRHPQRFDEVEQLLKDACLTVKRRSSETGEGATVEDVSGGSVPGEGVFNESIPIEDVPSGGVPKNAQHIWLGDSMGEMAAYYAASDLAIMGGSFLNYGGQNLIEACACGVPVILGPHTYNFAEASEQAIAAGAALRVNDAAGAIKAAQAVLQDPARLSTMREAALTFARAHAGATERTLAALLGII